VLFRSRRFESENKCSLTIMGEEHEVVRVAVAHAIADHGHEDTPELRDQVQSMLEPAEAYAEDRVAEPFPG